jgi:hypothetical protein
MELARRFAPFLVQNTGNIPTDFDAYRRISENFSVHVDEWGVGGAEVELEERWQVNLSALDGTACPGLGEPREGEGEAVPGGGGAASTPAGLADCQLLGLIERFTPGSGRTEPMDERLVRNPEAKLPVLFLDFPGSGPDDWDLGYEAIWRQLSEDERARFPHTYVHPFIHEVDEVVGPRRWEFVLQYWFFYPSNDSGMNHEGDWEHINVVVAPRSRVSAPLAADEIRDILEGTTDPADPLVLQRVDYYFHEFVMPVEFGVPNAYAPRAEWEAEMEALEDRRFGQTEVWRAARRLVWRDRAETRVNTHPFGYIGSDNKGLNQALEAPGGTNRDAHGTYPFPGRYNHVGPGGTTDQVDVHVDVRRYLDDLEAGLTTDGPVFRRESVVGFLTPGRIRLLPDWERVVPMVRESAEARRDWAWFVLPLRWGYPATQSPFAGILPHFNTGNNAPPGPSYNGGWGRVRANAGFELYDPHRLPALFPTQVQDAFRNDLGFLNLTIPALLNLPPLDVAMRWIAFPIRQLIGRPDPVFYPADSVPSRFVGVEAGVSFMHYSDEFESLLLNEQQFDAFVGTFIVYTALEGATPDTEVTESRVDFDPQPAAFLRVPFYIGSRFVSESLIRNSRGDLAFIARFSDIPEYRYTAELNFWEYAGSLRFNLRTGALKPYVKGGYGWTWYRLENAQAVGVPTDPATTTWLSPGLVPSTWHLGLGAEWVLAEDLGGGVGGFDIGLRAEVGRYWETLRLDLSNVDLDVLSLLFDNIAQVPGAARVARTDVSLSLSLSF